MSNINNEIKSLEKLLLFPDGFYKKLLEEDDWSFIIKLSALFEAVSSQALTIKFHYPEIEDAISHFDQADPKRGKIVLMKQLKIINQEQAKFMVGLAELRNKLAHQVSETNFCFKNYISKMDSQKKKSVGKIFGHGIKGNFKINGVAVNRTNCVLENTKLSIWVTAHEVLACIHADIACHKKIIEFKNRLWDTLLSSIGEQA